MAANDPKEDRPYFTILSVVFLFSLCKCVKELFIVSSAVPRKKGIYVFDLQRFGTIMLMYTIEVVPS